MDKLPTGGLNWDTKVCRTSCRALHLWYQTTQMCLQSIIQYI